MLSSSIVFPAHEWGGRAFDEVFPPERYKDIDGSIRERPHSWELRAPRNVALKNLSEAEIREIVKCSVHIPSQSAEGRARAALAALRAQGRYWPNGNT